jgi:hypothetical protein
VVERLTENEMCCLKCHAGGCRATAKVAITSGAMLLSVSRETQTCQDSSASKMEKAHLEPSTALLAHIMKVGQGSRRSC